MKKLGFKKIAVLWQDFESATEAAGYALIDNTTSEDQEWDVGQLAALLQGEEFQGMSSKEISHLTGFKDKELKGLLLTTTELPDVLPDVDLSGSIPDKADFIVLQFESKKDMQEFKKQVPTNSKHPRVIAIADLMSVMMWKEDRSIAQAKKKLLLKRKR